jgi:hypothetical protein
MNINNKNNLIIFFTFLIYISFFLGFYFNENSIGSGGYDGDLGWMWRNFTIYKSNDLWTSIHHPDFFGNRTPLLYILHILFNPFIFNIDSYRVTVFCISFLAPLVFYICLRQKFKNIDKTILFFISSFILLSPYYRTSAYWGLEINYGIISMLITIFFLNHTLYESISSKLKLYFFLILLTFFSSLCLYFDQKLLIIPLLVLFEILRSKINLKFKIFSLVNYSIYAIPFLYLIFIWKGIAPPLTQAINPYQGTHLSGINLNFFHIGYASAIMAFYLIPIIFLKVDNVVLVFRDFFSKSSNLYKVLIFLIYLIYIIFFNDYEDFTINKQWKGSHGVYGLGILHKISLILFNTTLYREIFTYLSFFGSWIIILVAIERKIINHIIIAYFYFLSLLLFPLMQEYFDPYIILFSLLILSLKFDFKFQKILSVFIYLVIFLASTNLYYFIKFS